MRSKEALEIISKGIIRSNDLNIIKKDLDILEKLSYEALCRAFNPMIAGLITAYINDNRNF